MEFGSEFSMIVQLVSSVALGALIGVERRMAHKSAGLRTFALVSLGATLFTIISLEGAKLIDQTFSASYDPSRIVAQIVSGVGFIGGGIIFFNKSKAHGVTTAAGLWVAAAVGMAVGFKMYAVAAAASIITFSIFTLMMVLERRTELLGYSETREGEPIIED